MIAVEFTATPKKGVITIPEQYRHEVEGEVRVILLKKESQEQGTAEAIQAILDKYKDVHPFQEIDDPIEWQRTLRSERERDFS